MVGVLVLLIVILLVVCSLIFAGMRYLAQAQAHNKIRAQLDNYVTASGASGEYEQQGTLNVFNLSGSYSEMGEQYGALAYIQLHAIYTQIVPKYFVGVNWRTLLSFVLTVFYYFKMDGREKEILQGMSKTSGLSFHQLLAIEMLPMLITLYSGFNGDKLSDMAGAGHCSFLAVWGSQAQTQSLLVARNLDLSTAVTQLDPYYSLVIYKPSHNGNRVASFSFIGFIPGFTWFSDKQLFAEYDDGRRSVPGFAFSGYIGLNTAFYAMLDAANKEQFIRYVKNHPAFISNFTAIADPENALAIEHAVNTQAAIVAGQTATSNFFTNLFRTNFSNAKLTMHNCIEKVKDTPSFASVRYRHIEEFLAKHPQLGIDELKQLFSSSLDEGGVYQTGASVNYPVAEVTNYTVIGELSSGKFIYSNHLNPNKWLHLDLKKYFKL